MTDPDPAGPLKRLHQVVVPVRTAEQEAVRRQHVVQRIATLQAQLREESAPVPPWRRAVQAARAFFAERSRAVSASGGLVLATALLAFFVLRGQSAPGIAVHAGLVFVESSRGRAALSARDEAVLAADEALATEGGAAELQLPSHAELAMRPHSTVRWQPDAVRGAGGEHLRLERGVVSLRVPKLAAGQSLSVATGDTLVEVHGTEFSVELVGGAGRAPSTRVTVVEGVVSVTRAAERVTLTAGQSWSSDAAKGHGHAVATDTSVAVPSASTEAAPSSAPSPVQGVAPGSARPSDLAEQNSLFLSAREARNNGNITLAVQRLEALMQRYPRSELAHNARVEHFRILESAGRLGEARASARRYVGQYPKGFARAEAEKLARP
jgi:FecR protein